MFDDNQKNFDKKTQNITDLNVRKIVNDENVINFIKNSIVYKIKTLQINSYK